MMKKIIIGALSLSVTALSADLSTVTSESVGVFSNELMRKEDRPLIYKSENFHEMATVPGFSLGAPSGLVGSYGVVFAGISGKTNNDDTDGALAFGMGFGNSEKIGGSVSLGVGSIDPRDGGAFNRGDLNINLGHNFKEYGLGWSVGTSGVDLWHDDSANDRDPSFYTSVTKLFPNELFPVAVTAGFGNNIYADVNKENDREDKIDGFGAVAVYLIPQVSIILDYTSNILTAGTSIVPFPQYPISVSLGVTNLTEQGPDDKVSVTGSIAAAYVF